MFALEYKLYFARTYVGQLLRGRRMPPRFTTSEWNVFQRTLDGCPRTNNANEGYNSALNRLFQKANTVMSQFILRIKHEKERTRNAYDK